MKRPIFCAAAAVIFGLLCGIRDTDTAVVLSMAAVSAILLYGNIKPVYIPVSIFISIISSINLLTGSLIKNSLKNSLDRFCLIDMTATVRANRLILSAFAVLFVCAYFRGSYAYHKYSSQECTEFYMRYEATNPGQFDYSAYLKAMDISSEAEYEEYLDERYGQGSGVTAKLGFWLKSILDECFSEKDAGLYKAILLGDRADMDEEIQDLYQRAGISHVLAVSGLHVSIIGMGISGILKSIPAMKNSAAGFLASLLIYFYMILCGAASSTIRAVVMMITGFAAAISKRSYDMRSALALAAIVILMYRPYQIFSSGFQLSFAAIAAINIAGSGIASGMEKLREAGSRRFKGNDRSDCQGIFYIAGFKRISKNNRLPVWAKTVIMSCAVQFTMLPIIAWNYYTFPVYGILLNLIVIPLMSIVVFSGIAVLLGAAAAYALNCAACAAALSFMSGILTMVSAGLLKISVLFGAPGHYTLRLYEILCEASLKLPHAIVCIGRPELSAVIIYYAVLAVLIIMFNEAHHFMLIRSIDNEAHHFMPVRFSDNKAHARCSVNTALFTGLLTALSVINTCGLKYREKEDFYITALDVGQGDGFVLKLGSSHMLIDCGSTSDRNVGERVLKPYLLSRGITFIDCIMISHADADHINGIRYLLEECENINTGKLVLPSAAEQDEKYDELKESFIKRGSIRGDIRNGIRDDAALKITYLSDLDMIYSSDDIRLSCVYAGNKAAEGDTNSQSDILMLEKGDSFSMLFTGDMPSEEDDSLLKLYSEHYKKDITVLKAAHHGSKTSTSEKLIEALDPQYAVISYGADNSYGHPSTEVVERLWHNETGIVSTAENGAVRITEEGIFSAME